MAPKDRRFAPPPLAPIRKPAVHAPPPVAQMKVMPGLTGAVSAPSRWARQRPETGIDTRAVPGLAKAARSIPSVLQMMESTQRMTVGGLREARRQILLISNERQAQASQIQVAIHDAAIHTGQHNPARVVTVGALIDDIDDMIAFLLRMAAKRATNEKKGGGGDGDGSKKKKGGGSEQKSGHGSGGLTENSKKKIK